MEVEWGTPMRSQRFDVDVCALLFDVYNRAMKDIARDQALVARVDIEVQRVAAEALLRAADEGERDPHLLQRLVRNRITFATRPGGMPVRSDDAGRVRHDFGLRVPEIAAIPAE